MAKKSRRRKPRLSPAQLVQPDLEVSDDMAELVVAPESGEMSLQDEYRYVLADLKRIAILAVVMLAVLIGLAFVIT
jgi:hypothetical protein